MLIRGKQIADGTIGKNKLSFDLYHEHVQAVANSIWTINHGLGKFGNVTIYDGSNFIIDGQVETLNNNTIRIIFNDAVSGRVIIT